MRIPYRTRKWLGRAGLTAAVAALILALVWLCWVIWLGRYVRYTRDGVELDFTMEPIAAGEVARQPEPEDPFPIYYNEGDNQINTSKELEKVLGYYIDEAQLRAGVDTVISQVKALPNSTVIMLDVKNMQGAYFYSSQVGALRSDGVDAEAVDELIRELKQGGYYTIARFPALRDCEFARNNIMEAITDRRGYVWMDTQHGYWLDPTRQKCITYVIDLVTELKSLGFNEVVLDDYDIPVEEHVIFSAERPTVLTELANTLMTTCGSDSFGVSFVKSSEFTMPAGRTRLYVKDADAATAPGIAENSGMADPAVQVVFITENHDTRFEEYGVLRPLSSAH